MFGLALAAPNDASEALWRMLGLALAAPSDASEALWLMLGLAPAAPTDGPWRSNLLRRLVGREDDVVTLGPIAIRGILASILLPLPKGSGDLERGRPDVGGRDSAGILIPNRNKGQEILRPRVPTS